ncbi:hypothetical protein SAMN05444172_6548 [Burkholderia sp. GAS332]|nr:hypothetical protein SAMN05444172_6548 [Burkholderia sp. GAS332]
MRALHFLLVAPDRARCVHNRRAGRKYNGFSYTF